MSVTTDVMNQALDLAKTQQQNYKKLVTSTDATDIPAPACAVDDKDCINRWISAFSDCD